MTEKTGITPQRYFNEWNLRSSLHQKLPVMMENNDIAYFKFGENPSSNDITVFFNVGSMDPVGT